MRTVLVCSTETSDAASSILLAIPFFLALHENSFGDEIEDFVMRIYVDVHFTAHLDINEPFNYFSSQLAVTPRANYLAERNRLDLEYTSKLDLSAGNPKFKGYDLRKGDDSACQLFAQLLEEIQLIIYALGEDIDEVCAFDWRKLTRLIDEKRSSLPETDREIKLLQERSFFDVDFLNIFSTSSDEEEQEEEEEEEEGPNGDFVLPKVLWNFSDKKYSRMEFDEEIANYHREVNKANTWNPNEVVVEAPAIIVIMDQYESLESMKTVQYTFKLKAPNLKEFTASDLMYALHCAIQPALQKRVTDAFFEGLWLDPNESERDRLPLYKLALGS
jgi:hypothetical protein